MNHVRVFHRSVQSVGSRCDALAAIGHCFACSDQTAPELHVEEQRQKSRKYTIGLCLGGLVALLAHLGIYATALPVALKTQTWVLFFPLWFLLAVPLLQARDPGWMSAAKVQGSIRRAKLEDRFARPLAMRALWVGAALVWIAFIVLATPFIQNPQDWFKLPQVILLGVSLLSLLIGFLMCELLALEPEPYAEHGTDLLAKKYFDFRRTRTLLTYVLFVSCALLFETLALLLLMHSSPQLLAWVGALGGSVAGILGGVVGVWSSFRRAELNRMVLENPAN